ncbi:uncharacterized protein LOC103520623 isoform X2 [Diaphorina citri]|uniref:Uncharacterized protein LOC103520623 isoform X2 n=1 Tax=Diaphorina citri TaxID=121845 RepID=A0A1S3DLG9_DIACI|nr:uncharacterized protein LOC103520623 isoform X2 [Diaphorina citri]
MYLIWIPAVATFFQLFVSLDAGTATGRIFLSDSQKNTLCTLDTKNFPSTFCRNINVDQSAGAKPDYLAVAEQTCNLIAKALHFQQGTCMQSKSRFLGFVTGITEGCAITNSSADISTIDLNKGSNWIFIMYAPQGTLGDDTQIECGNGLKDFDATA